MSANDDFSLHDDEELSLHDDASLAGLDQHPKRRCSMLNHLNFIPQITLSLILYKNPVLQKDDYDTWAMEMEHYLEYIDNEVWKVIQNGNSKKRVTKGKDGVYRVLPPTTQEEQIWAAIKTRFGGNANSKKMQKAVLKQQFEAFTISSKESLEKGYDRFQKLLSQLDALGASVSDEDANHKFLRSLPPAWDSLAMTMRTKKNIDTLSIDDLYNNLSVFEQDIQKTSSSSLTSDNVAFLSQAKASSSKHKPSHNSGSYSSYTTSSSKATPTATPGLADEVIHSFLATNADDVDLIHEDLDQIDDLDLEEMDINWQIAMTAIKIKKFYKKTGRRPRVDGKMHVAFDKRKVECFNCHNTGHFARECKFKSTKDGSRQEASRGQDFKPVRTEKEALMTIDEGQINWVEQTTDEEINHALMAFTVNNEVSMCSKLCLDSYNALKAKYDELQSEFGDQEAALTAHKLGLKKVEAQLRASHKQQISLNEKLHFQANQIFEKDEKLKKYRRIGMKAVKDKDALQKIVDSWFASSKNLWKLIDCGMSSTVKLGLGYSIKSNAEVLSYEEEMNRGIFASIRETDPGYYDIPLYSRFKQVEYKGVPHPLSGDYTPREQEDIDDSLYEYGKYGPQPQTPSPTVSNTSSIVFSICPSNDRNEELGAVSDASSTHYSTCQSNDSDGELGTVTDHSVNDDPISTQKTQSEVSTPTQTVDPSCAQHVKPPRQPIRTPVTSSPIPLNNRQNWNQRMQRDLDQQIRRIHQLDTTYRPFHSEHRIYFYSLNGVSVPPNNTTLITTWDDLVEKFVQKFYQLSDHNEDIEEDNDPNDITDIFKIEGNLFDFETPLCEAFSDFNYLLKIDKDLFTFDIQGTGTYEESELNNPVTRDLEEPWLDNGVPYQLCDHICKPYHFKNGITKWPTCSLDIDGFCNGGELPGTVRVGSMTYFQDHKHFGNFYELDYNVLVKLQECWWKINANEVAPFTRLESYGQRPYANIKTEMAHNPYLEVNNIFARNYDISNAQDNQGHDERRDDPTLEPSVYNIRRFEMMKYSFNLDEEYIAIKESEYFNHSKDNLDAYRELLRIINEGWVMATADEE
ncbi:ribonuclease H-like domain-containing protein [Tanacetum coccineum]